MWLRPSLAYRSTRPSSSGRWLYSSNWWLACTTAGSSSTVAMLRDGEVQHGLPLVLLDDSAVLVHAGRHHERIPRRLLPVHERDGPESGDALARDDLPDDATERILGRVERPDRRADVERGRAQH